MSAEELDAHYGALQSKHEREVFRARNADWEHVLRGSRDSSQRLAWLRSRVRHEWEGSGSKPKPAGPRHMSPVGRTRHKSAATQSPLPGAAAAEAKASTGAEADEKDEGRRDGCDDEEDEEEDMGALASAAATSSVAADNGGSQHAVGVDGEVVAVGGSARGAAAAAATPSEAALAATAPAAAASSSATAKPPDFAVVGGRPSEKARRNRNELRGLEASWLLWGELSVADAFGVGDGGCDEAGGTPALASKRHRRSAGSGEETSKRARSSTNSAASPH